MNIVRKTKGTVLKGKGKWYWRDKLLKATMEEEAISEASKLVADWNRGEYKRRLDFWHRYNEDAKNSRNNQIDFGHPYVQQAANVIWPVEVRFEYVSSS